MQVGIYWDPEGRQTSVAIYRPTDRSHFLIRLEPTERSPKILASMSSLESAWAEASAEVLRRCGVLASGAQMRGAPVDQEQALELIAHPNRWAWFAQPPRVGKAAVSERHSASCDPRLEPRSYRQRSHE